MTSPSQALLQCSQQLHRAKTQLADVERASREGWRYADELEQERKRLHAANQELVAALKEFSDYVHMEQSATDGAVTYSNTQIHRLVFLARAAMAKAEAA